MIWLLACSGVAPTDGVGVDSVSDSLSPDSADSADSDSAGWADTAVEETASPPLACSYEGLEEVQSLGPVGGFDLEVDAQARVTASQQGHTVFASPSRGAFWVAHAELHAEEHQGSFTLDEGIGGRCESDALLSIRQSEVGDVELTVETDCAGVSVRWRFCQPSEGHLAFEVDSGRDLVALWMARDSGEKVFGLGEQFPHDSLDLVGREIPVIAQEGGVGRGHQPISAAVDAFSPGSAGSEDSTYAPSAHFLTSEDRSLFLENEELSVFDFTGSHTEVRVHSGTMKGRVLYGTEPLELIERFTEWAGRMPAIPDWANEGAIVALARPLDESLEIVDALRAEGALVAGVWNQTWSGINQTYIGEQVLWNWTLNKEGWHDYVDALEDRDVRVLCYVNSMFIVEPPYELERHLYEEGVAGGYFVRDEAGDVLELPVTAFDIAMLDLSNEDARDWMKSIIQDELLGEARCSGWMADFAEALPYEAHMADGTDGSVWHNRYPVEWAALNKEAVQEAGRLGDVLIFNRSGHTRTPGASLLMWQGDQLTTWDKYDGLVSALHGLINSGFSGLSLNHSDIGGYTSLSKFGLGYSRESEQLKRWTEMAAFTAVMRTHEGNQPGENAQIYSDDEAMEHFARFTRVYAALAFYRAELFEDAEDKGWPVVRHLALHHPDDPRAWEVDDQFLLGEQILVAPIKNKCWTWPWCPYDKELYLPEGTWVHLWTGDEYGGENTITVPAPIGEPAVFVRKDWAGLPTLIDNLAEMGISAG